MTAAVMAVALVLPLSSCGKPPQPAAPLLSLLGCECTAEYSGRVYTLNVTNSPQSLFTVSFTSPESLDGFVCTFMSNGSSVSFDNLSYKSDSATLGACSLPRILYDIFRSAESTPLTPENSAQQDTAVFTGSTGRFEYTISTDFSTGKIKSIVSKEMDINLKAVI